VVSFPAASISSSSVLKPISSTPLLLFIRNINRRPSGLCRKNNVYNYAVSVPWRKVRQSDEVILAWEMNGEPLPKMHGAPLRVVVTGYIGARSCKWVYKINAIAEPSLGPVQAQEYLYYTPQVSRCYRGSGMVWLRYDTV
jgi:hypothetical protein